MATAIDSLTGTAIPRQTAREDNAVYGTAAGAGAQAPATQNIEALSIIVPTRNEAANVTPLLERINTTLSPFPIEVIFVDDSDDDTPQVIQAQASHFSFPVSVIARPPERRNGLGKAVVEGLDAAQFDWVCVMDGDLQHPPEVIPQLLQAAESSNANLVAASRLTKGGNAASLGPARHVLSYCLALVSRICFMGKLGRMTDPLTGFFLVQRQCLQTDELQPEGFKILLEILVRTPNLVATEVPFSFGARHAGQSKANAQEMVRLGRQMVKLSLVSQQQLLRFLAVGLSGIVVNTLLMVLLVEWLGAHYLLAAIVATQGSTLWNFVWTERWVFEGRGEKKTILPRLAGFAVMNNLFLLLRGPFLALLVSVLALNYAVANIISLVAMFVVRFGISDRLIWRRNEKQRTPGPYSYDIHGLVRVRSAQRLPELSYFLVDEPFTADDVDIDIQLAWNPARDRTHSSISYQDFLGRLGFCIVINQGEERTDVTAGHLVGLSPHVLYTNVVEPILRWTFARKGYALMHGATLAHGERALFITARTDTGKTTTILHTIRQDPDASHFLSDDMTILSPNGTVRSFPKPLTISKHTLQAIGGAPLTRTEYAFLQIQSRIHSKSGRMFALLISKLRLPAATINTIVQMIIPPPKFMVDRIIPQAHYANKAKLGQIVVIERGEDYEEAMPEHAKFSTLLANAEDAYGFPPYPQIAHRLSQWKGHDLHEVEQAVVTAAVDGLPATQMGSSCFDWYKRLPTLLATAPVPTEPRTKAIFPQWMMEPLGLEGQAAAD